MTLRDLHTSSGAQVADDGIPLLYSDPLAEYEAALTQAVLLDRSHEGRLHITGSDRAEVLHRISTNALRDLAPGSGRATVFTNANARILDRALVYAQDAERLLVIGGPGRGAALRGYLQRNIFFRDQARLHDISADTVQMSLHGPAADAVAEALLPGAAALPPFGLSQTTMAGVSVVLARREALSGAHWLLTAPAEAGAAVWTAVLAAGAPHGLRPAGSLTYNVLRIRAGQPGVGRELSAEYIPLEVGLWDDISFNKGCYTGQEIIARMESRGRLARALVHLALTAMLEAPAPLLHDGKRAGMLTSSVTAPDGTVYALGVVRMMHATPGATLLAGDGAAAVEARVLRPAGTLPAFIQPETEDAR